MDDILSADSVLRSRELHGHWLARGRAGSGIGLQRLLCQSESRVVTFVGHLAAKALICPRVRYLVELLQLLEVRAG